MYPPLELVGAVGTEGIAYDGGVKGVGTAPYPGANGEGRAPYGTGVCPKLRLGEPPWMGTAPLPLEVNDASNPADCTLPSELTVTYMQHPSTRTGGGKAFPEYSPTRLPDALVPAYTLK